MKTQKTETREWIDLPRLVRHSLPDLVKGCIVKTDGGEHKITDVMWCSEAISGPFYRWDASYPYSIEHAAMDPMTDTIIAVSWPNGEINHE